MRIYDHDKISVIIVQYCFHQGFVSKQVPLNKNNETVGRLMRYSFLFKQKFLKS